MGHISGPPGGPVGQSLFLQIKLVLPAYQTLKIFFKSTINLLETAWPSWFGKTLPPAPPSTLLYSTLLYSTPLYSTLLYSTLLYSTLLYSTLLYSTLLYSTLLYSTLLYSTLLYFTLHYSTLLNVILKKSILANNFCKSIWKVTWKKRLTVCSTSCTCCREKKLSDSCSTTPEIRS